MSNGWISRGWGWRSRFSTPAGHHYLGPCRCGFGPHAFYGAPQGKIVHASQLFSQTAQLPTLKPEEEAKFLEEDAKALQEELKRIEERLKELKK